MSDIELACLNSIRYAIKQYLRWEWELPPEEWHRCCDAMDYLEDLLWVEFERRYHVHIHYT